MAIKSLKSGSYGRSVKAGNSIILPGDYESIATTTVGSGGTATVTFSSIPGTYTHLQIRMFAKSGGTAVPTDNLALKFNGGDTSTQSSHFLEGNGSTASSSGRTNSGELADMIGRNGNWGSCVIDILDYANTNKYKTIRGLGGADANGSGVVSLASLNWRSTSAITSILIDPNGNSFSQYSHIALYGIRG